LRSLLRNVDIPCRAGGDAFSLILPHTNSAQARIAINRLHRGLVEVPYVIGNKSFRFRTHFGIAEATSTVGTADELLRRAEQAEYVARNVTDVGPIFTYPDPENSVRDSTARGRRPALMSVQTSVVQ
jgi:diguanylate cyclase (GGDEF)-like protein